MIDVAVPQPDRDSGSLRAFNLMRAMRELGHAVDFLPDDRNSAGAHGAQLRALGIGLHVAPDAGAYPHWLARHGQRYDAVVVCRYHLGEFLIPLLRRIVPHAQVVLDTVDLHHLREGREAALRDDHVLERLAAETRRRELGAIASADVSWVVSPYERDLLLQALPGARIEVLPNIHEPAASTPGFDIRSGFLFLGGARHPPNVDAVRWLLQDIAPLLQAALPTAAVHVVGDGFPQALGDISVPTNVHIHGYVEDIDGLLAGCRVGLAPLRFGAGVKGKVTACMAAGMPVVATAVAAEGMHLRDGQDVLLGDTATAFAEAATRLHADAALWQALSEAGVDNVQQHFSFNTARAALAATFQAKH